MDLSNKEENKKTRRRGYESLLLLLLIISLFVTATYAWFTDTAYSTGNTVFSGNMNVEIIVDEQEMFDYIMANYKSVVDTIATETDYQTLAGTLDGDTDKLYHYIAFDFATREDNPATPQVEGLGLKYYTRAVINHNYNPESDDESKKYLSKDIYYIVTGKELALINIYNMEPGQLKKINLKYLNIGDLALKASGALKVQLDADNNPVSYTGLETLNQQFAKQSLQYLNDYAVIQGENTQPYIDPKDKIDPDSDKSYYHVTSEFSGNAVYKDNYENYSRIFDKLIKFQGEKATEGETNVVKQYKLDNEAASSYIEYDANKYVLNDYVDANSLKYIDSGKKLEEVLEVYVGVDENTPRRVYEEKDPNYYFGSFEQFQFVVEKGFEALPDFDYDSYASLDDEASIKALDDLDKNYSDNPDSLTNEEKYILMRRDTKANLFNDYQKYLSLASGYCVPKDAIIVPHNEPVTETYGIKDMEVSEVESDKVNVIVTFDTIDSSGQPIEAKISYVASEIGNTSFYVHMAEDATSAYQNASMSLALGVTATQIEYERDDTGNMTYDKQVLSSTPKSATAVFFTDTGDINSYGEQNKFASDFESKYMNTLKYKGFNSINLMNNDDSGEIPNAKGNYPTKNQLYSEYVSNFAGVYDILALQFYSYDFCLKFDLAQTNAFMNYPDKTNTHIYFGAYPNNATYLPNNYYIGYDANDYLKKIVEHFDNISEYTSDKSAAIIYDSFDDFQYELIGEIEKYLKGINIGVDSFDINSSIKVEDILKHEILITLDESFVNDQVNTIDGKMQPNSDGCQTSWLRIILAPYLPEDNKLRTFTGNTDKPCMDAIIYMNSDKFLENVEKVIEVVAVTEPKDTLTHNINLSSNDLIYEIND